MAGNVFSNLSFQWLSSTCKLLKHQEDSEVSPLWFLYWQVSASFSFIVPNAESTVRQVAMWEPGGGGHHPWWGPHESCTGDLRSRTSKWLVVLGDEAAICYSSCGEPLKPLHLIKGGVAIDTKPPGTRCEAVWQKGHLALAFSPRLLSTASDSQGGDARLCFCRRFFSAQQLSK